MLTPRFLSVGSVTVTVKRKTAGSYVNSRWQDGTESTLTIKANVQPNLSGRDVRTLPEGDRSKKTIKLYTVSDLKVAEQGELLEGDKVQWNSEWYEVRATFPYQMGVLNHTKAICVREETT
jgi:hypothetical protein